MTDLAYDALHWEVGEDGILRPRATLLKINYPAEEDVEDGVPFGYEDQYEGTLPTTGESPDAPVLESVVAGDEVLTVTVSSNDADEPVYIIYRTAAGGWTLPDDDLMLTEDGSIDITGLHNGTLYYVCVVSKVGLTYSLPSSIFAARPEQAGTVKARYRVKAIRKNPARDTKTLIVERIERPTHP